MSLLDKMANEAPTAYQGQAEAPTPVNMRERVLQQHQELEHLRSRVTNIEQGIEKLVRMLVDQMGLQL